MKKYSNIIVGVNYTDSSKQALLRARQIADASGASLTVFHVVPMHSEFEYESSFLIGRDKVRENALTGLEDFTARVLGADHTAICEIAEGLPYLELLRYADSSGADLLVLGANENASVYRKSGQFAVQCIRDAKIPVLLTRGEGGSVFRKISACVDFSDATAEVIRNAAIFANRESEPIDIVHAVRPPWMRPTHVLYTLEQWEDDDYKKQFREMLEAQISSVLQTATVENNPANFSPVTIEHTDPVEALLEHIRTHSIDLAVVGRWGHGMKALKNYMLGGTAESLIRHAHCSILTVPVEIETD